MNILTTSIGDTLTPLVKPPITLEQLQRYAEASGDHNPIHLDEEAARRVGLDGVIAHGMLSMAFLGQFISQYLSEMSNARLAQLRVRFLRMVRLGDTLTCHGMVKAHSSDDEPAGSDKGYTRVMVECWVQNQRGEKVTIGEAVIIVPLNPPGSTQEKEVRHG